MFMITIEWEIQERRKEIIKKLSKEDNFTKSNRKMSNIAIAILER